MNLKDKTVIVIGGTSGLGYSLVEKLKGETRRSIVTGRDSAKLAEISKEMRDDDKTFELDLMSNDSIIGFANKVSELDDDNLVLVCNAGIWLEGDSEDEDFLKIDDVINTNLTGYLKLVSKVLPAMQAKKKGHVLFVNSVAGIDHNGGNSFYSASKFGLLGFAKALQSEVVKDDIKITSFHPGGMNTDLFNRAGHDYGDAEWMMDKDKIAEIIVSVIGQPDNMLIDQISIRTFPDNILTYGAIE